MVDETIANGCVCFLKEQGFEAYAHKNKVFIDIVNQDESYSASIQLVDDDVVMFNSLYIERLQEASLLDG